MDKPLVLVDGSSYLFRAYHALPPLTTSKGQATGAVKGVLNMLLSLLKQYEPTHIAVVFDAKGPTFRNELYSEYKANRPPMPDDLRSQIEPLHECVKALGLPLIVEPGIEADDVIGTLAAQATQQGIETIISTGDKDMAQLVNEHVTLINTMSNTTLDVAGVVEKFGVRPDQVIDYLALMGDKVDNIPGVEKCGPKTAVKWLEAYETLDGVIANADKVGGKIGENLRAAIDTLPLSYELATIKLDCQLNEVIDDLKIQEEDKQRLIELYTELEFKTWLERLLEGAVGNDELEAVNKIEQNYDVVTDEAVFLTWLEKLRKADIFAFDTETTSLNYMEARVVGVSFSVEPGEAAYVPFGHDLAIAPDQLNEEFVLAQLKPILEDPKLHKVGQNLKYDAEVLANHDIYLQGIVADTMLMSYVFNSVATRHDMDSLSLKYLGHKTIKFEEVAGKGAKQLTFNQIPLDVAGPYAAEDADITLRLYQVLNAKLAKEPKLLDVLNEIEIPVSKVLTKMEQTGALVDGAMLKKQSGELAKRILEIEKHVHDLAGQEFNLASPKQLADILFTQLELPVIKKTPKGAPSTAEDVLQELALDFPLPKALLEFRSLSKLKSTYTDKLPEMISPTTGRVHSSFHQAVAATGRLSSSDPNLQNIPIRNEEGRKIRQAFIAPQGYKLLAADYSQIELRIMAHLSGDKGLLDAFSQGLDIHKATAAEVFGMGLDQVTSEQRRSAKAINFGLIYGMSAFGLAKQLGVGRHEAQDYINLYFSRYPGVQQYMDDIRERAHQQGYVETLFGRRLYLPEINARNKMRQQAAERTAINAPMQGTAADIIKKAMICVDDWLTSSNAEGRMIMQVHDELVFEVKAEAVEKFQPEIERLMSGAAKLDVPLLVESGIGDNWDQAH